MSSVKHYMNFYLIKWIIISLVIGFLAGSASAIFLIALEWATTKREEIYSLIYFLPIAGFLVGITYYKFGREVAAGNNLIITEIRAPKEPLKLRMAPFILLSTVITHLFGGSAGREGSAVQMGASIADQLSILFKPLRKNRKLLLIAGMSAGFASVFGTPIAGTVFSIEVFIIGTLSYEAVLPALLSAVIADHVTQNIWNVHHSIYNIPSIPELTFASILFAILAGIIFGGTSRLFSESIVLIKNALHKTIKFTPLHGVVGGILIVLMTTIGQTTMYNGLGLETISKSFVSEIPIYVFIIKILFTAVTLGAGYKGGEVTCLFFIGATLGNALSMFIPLPMALLAGMGFVAVFAGASNTPLACTIMGLELFGAEGAVYIGIACFISYLFSGHGSIYSSQQIGVTKRELNPHFKDKTFVEIKGKR